LGACTTEEKYHGIGSIQKVIGKGERTVKLTRSYTYGGSGKQSQPYPYHMLQSIDFPTFFAQVVQIIDQITQR
jgi:hypothetical protein